LRISALSAADTARFRQAANALGLLSHVFSERQTYWVDLDLVRERHGGNFLATRSANTRQQLRGALKRLRAEHGEFSLTPAATLAQGHAWLDALANLHRQRWNARGETDGFANPAFCRYHHTLVEQLLGSGEIQILRASAGTETLAYLYNLVNDGRVYFDMSGVDHLRHARHRPGLVAHWQAIEWYLQRGMRIYDFQAGTNRYKQSLATHSAVQTDLVLRRPRLRFRLEAFGRWLKRRMAQAA
jgi:CelD/BcsL family acetyltransferase involved in cellulose biosynthesis